MLCNSEKVSYEVREGALLIRVRGEIDHHSAVLVRAGIDSEILAKRPQKVLLELSAVDFMDSSGLGLIMGRYALIKQYGGVLEVVNPSSAVVKIMKLAGMERIIPITQIKEKKE